MTNSATSMLTSAASEQRLSMGTPSRRAIRAAALSSAFRVRIVDGLQGWSRLPLASRLR
jgi:hypothetical protein